MPYERNFNNTIGCLPGLVVLIFGILIGIGIGAAWGESCGRNEMKSENQAKAWIKEDGLTVHTVNKMDTWEMFFVKAPDDISLGDLIFALRDRNVESGYIAWDGSNRLVPGDKMLVPNSFENLHWGAP